MDSHPSPTAYETICANLRLTLRGLLAALGMWRLDAAQAIRFYNRTGGIAQKIERLLMRYRAGRLTQVTRATRPAATAQTRGETARRGPALPRKFGWLVMAGKHEAVCYGLQLQTMLNTPEMRDLLAASPQAVRILRPLCRALAIEMPGHPERARQTADQATPRKRKPRPKPEPFRIPLPRGAITWARREGYGRIR